MLKRKQLSVAKQICQGHPGGEDSFWFLLCLHGLHSITHSPGQREELWLGLPLPRRQLPPLKPSLGSPAPHGAVLRGEFAMSHRELFAVEMGPLHHCLNLLLHRDPRGTPAQMCPARAASGAFI